MSKKNEALGWSRRVCTTRNVTILLLALVLLSMASAVTAGFMNGYDMSVPFVLLAAAWGGCMAVAMGAAFGALMYFMLDRNFEMVTALLIISGVAVTIGLGVVQPELVGISH
jgi:hypothetical protein